MRVVYLPPGQFHAPTYSTRTVQGPTSHAGGWLSSSRRLFVIRGTWRYLTAYKNPRFTPFIETGLEAFRDTRVSRSQSLFLPSVSSSFGLA